MLVRESVVSQYVLVHVQKDLTCASACDWCVRVKCSGASVYLKVRALLPLVRESELVLARTKKGYYVCLNITCE